MREPVLAALDLSLQGAAAVAAPYSWDQNFARFKFASFGRKLSRDASERELTQRLIDLALDLRTWLIWAGATKVVIEDLPTFFHRARAGQLLKLAELRGVMRRELLVECKLDVEFIDLNEARTQLYGTRPPKGLTTAARKRWLTAPVHLIGAPFTDHDQVDAFCTWVHAAHELGIPAPRHLLGTPEHFDALRKEAARERAKQKRRRAA